MRRAAWMLALVLLGSPAAHADDAEPADAGAGAEVIDRCAPPHGLKPDLADAYGAACTFFGAVADRNVDGLAPLVHAPFYFEGKQVASADEVTHRWKQLLAALGGDPSTFYSLEVLTYDDMVKKYGKPPAKLDAVPMHGAVIAVANFDGRAEIAALKRDGEHWVVFAFHD